MEEKKITKAQLEKRIKNAQLIVDKGSAYKAIYFADRGIGIYICKDYVIVSSNFHQHVWNKVIGTGYNKPCLYLEQMVDIANAHIDEISDKNPKDEVFYSLTKLMSISSLSNDEKLLLTLVERYIYVINDGIYCIGNEPQDITNLMLQYLCWLAKSNIFVGDRDEDILRNEFYNKFISTLRFIGLDVEIDNSLNDELKDKIAEIEENAYNQIKNYIEDKSGKMIDVVALPKRTDDEAIALKELQS